MAADTTPKRRAPRKSTFTARKEEKQRLEREISALHAQLRVLEGYVAGTDRLRPSAAASPSPSSILPQRTRGRDRHAAFAGVRALLSSYFSSRRATAVAVPIHLPRDASARRALLTRSSATRIGDARQLMRERCRFLDLTQAHAASEWFERDDGSMVLLQFDITPLRGVRCGVRDVYDAVGFYAQNVELYVTDRLGDLTIREDDDVDATTADGSEPRVSQRRLMSTTSVGLTIDANVTVFRQYFPAGACPDMPQEHAIFGTQAVDSDELYPFVPNERVRHDLDGACLIQQVATRDGELVTTLARASAITRHSTNGVHTIPEDMQAPLRALAVQWSDLMLLAVRERVCAMAATNSASMPSASPASSFASASSTSSP